MKKRVSSILKKRRVMGGTSSNNPPYPGYPADPPPRFVLGKFNSASPSRWAGGVTGPTRKSGPFRSSVRLDNSQVTRRYKKPKRQTRY